MTFIVASHTSIYPAGVEARKKGKQKDENLGSHHEKSAHLMEYGLDIHPGFSLRVDQSLSFLLGFI